MRIFFAIVSLVILLSGCEKKATTATGATVECRVVVVLKSGDQIGNTNNIGCRLSAAQVNQYMQALNRNGAKYGNNATFSWNSQPLIWFDPSLQGRSHSLINWLSLAMNPNSPDRETGHDATKINIYFVGHFVDPDDPSSFFRGNTADPLDGGECTNLPQQPHVFITDRGFLNPNSALVNTADRILEHEVCHYLIRQRAARPPYTIQGIPVCPALPAQGAGRYDPTEHDPQGSHLMKPAFPHGEISSVDASETATRVINHLYRQP